LRKSSNPIDVHVGSRLRLRRSLIGMSQEDLGQALGLTFQQIQKYEKGINRISAGRLHRLADLLSVSVQFFYNDLPPGLSSPADRIPGFDEPEPDAAYISSAATLEGVQLQTAFSKIKDLALRRRIVNFVQSIAEQRSAEVPSDQPAG
jgi:transcriptional regulator with XRE-family HTH domain